MAREMPAKHDAILRDVWTALWGYNGETGLVSRVEKLENRPRNRWLRVKDWAVLIALVVMVISFLFGETPKGGWLSRVKVVPVEEVVNE